MKALRRDMLGRAGGAPGCGSTEHGWTVRAAPLLAVAAVVAACGPAPAPDAPPLPAPPPPAPAPPRESVVTPARWRPIAPDKLPAAASVPLQDGAQLFFGRSIGLRWIATKRSAEPPKSAPTVLPEGLVGAVREGSRWAFVGASGRVYLADEPLGRVTAVRKAPTERVRAVSGGRAATVAVSEGGDVLRSTDAGASWARVELPVAPSVPFDVALRPDGTGLLLAAPQRVFATTDDGATWSRIASAGPGATGVALGPTGELVVDGATGRSRLEGSPPRLVAMGDEEGNESPAKHASDREAEQLEWSARRIVSGKRLLSAAMLPGSSRPSRWKVSVADLDQPSAWKSAEQLDDCGSVLPSGFGGALYLGCVRDAERPASGGAAPPQPKGKRPASHRMTILRNDGGPAFRTDLEIDVTTREPQLRAGPGGWLMIRETCREDRPEDDPCVPYRVRPAGQKDIWPLEGLGDARVVAYAIDDAGERFVVLGVQDGELRIGEMPLSATTLTWREGPSLTVSAPPNELRGDVAVGEDGAIVAVANPEKKWKALRAGKGSETFESSDIQDDLTINQIALIGERGLVRDHARQLWETADGGRSWVRVSSPQPTWDHMGMSCRKDGCFVAGTARLGWDLAGRGAPPPPHASVPRPGEGEAKKPVRGATPLKCTAGEGAPAIEGVLLGEADGAALLVPSADARFALPASGKRDAVELAIVSTGEKGVTVARKPLLGAPPHREAFGSMTEVFVQPDGVVARRYSYARPSAQKKPSGGLNPVRADVAWWRPQDGKVHVARIVDVGSFRVRAKYFVGATAGAPAAPEVLALSKDGVSFHPELYAGHPKGGTVYLLRDSGRVERLEGAEPNGWAGEGFAARAASGIAVGALPQDGGAAAFAIHPEKAEKGKTPDAFRWLLVPPDSKAFGAHAIVSLKDEAAFVSAWRPDPDALLRGFLVPLRPGADPPAVLDLPLASVFGPKPRVCGEGMEKAPRLVARPPRAARRAVVVEGAGSPMLLEAEQASLAVGADGQACAVEWIAKAPASATAAVIPFGDPSKAWLLAVEEQVSVGEGARSKVTVRPMKCAEAPEGVPDSLGWKGFTQ